MKGTINGKGLREALAAGTLGRGSDQSIYRHALLEAGSGFVTVTTTDSQTLTAVRVAAYLPEGFIVAADADRLKAVMLGIDGDVTVELSDNRLTLSTGPRRRFSIPVLPAEHFPRFEQATEEAVQVDAAELRAAVSLVRYAAADNDVRVYFNGVIIGRGRVSASNGHRFATAPLSENNLPEKEIIVPKAAIAPLLAALEQEGSRVWVLRQKADVIALRAGSHGHAVTIRLIWSPVPDLMRAIPGGKEDSLVTITDVVQFGMAIDRVSPSAKGPLRLMRLEGDGDGIRLSTDEADDEAPATVTAPFHIGISCIYLREALKACGGEAQIAVRGKMDTVVITPVGRSDIHAIAPAQV